MRLALLFLLAVPVFGGEDPIYPIGKDVSPPRILNKTEPKYTQAARTAQVQGSSLWEIVIDQNGDVARIQSISPLGFGLDEQAEATIKKWKFAPATKDGRPVRVMANVEVNFRLLGQYFDHKLERRRTTYNAAVMRLKTGEGNQAGAVESILDFSREKFPPAMYAEGVWLRDGTHGPADPEKARALLQAAADKDYGPAIYELGRMYFDGNGVPVDQDKGLQMIRDASVLGSSKAQLFLGIRYEVGDGVPRDVERARRYLRLCAAASDAVCQLRLARLLLKDPDRQERHTVQAIAWLELASGAGLAEATRLLQTEKPKLTPTQVEPVDKLKSQLIPKP